MEDALRPVAARLGPEGININKHALSQVHRCERLQVAESATRFSWSPATARGTVIHKALELSATLRPEVHPGDLVDLAIERLVEAEGSWGPGAWLDEAPAAEVAELRMVATDMVTKMGDTFPRLRLAWRPRVESTLIADLCDRRIRLKGKLDLALGQAEGNRAKVLILDFKSGHASHSHVEDLRFYALLETLRVGVPPFRLASWYLDSGTWMHEDVTEPLLWAAARRVVDGVRVLVELKIERREPTVSPGGACGYCPERSGCAGAVAWAEQRAALGVDVDGGVGGA